MYNYNSPTPDNLPSPCYVVYEEALRRNLSLINDVERRAGVKIIMAFKANALWRTFDIIGEYNRDFTASSLNELKLGNETLGGQAHSYCPVYTPQTIDEFIGRSSHITFNSIAQARLYADRAVAAGVSCGLRVNPQCSVIETDIYNPALPGSRFGVSADELKRVGLPENIDGLHFHALCESTSYDLERVLEAFERDFGEFLPRLKWVNMGGGHLMTRSGYDTDHLVTLLSDFRRRHPNISVILEPGSAFTWQTGVLKSTVLDVVENSGIRTAIIDASFACHMPDCLEMPYKPAILEALPDVDTALPTYRLGGNSCLSGDFVGDWSFEKELRPGDPITFLDMNHYTTVKTTMFNGIQHPAMALVRTDGTSEILREFTYDDYKSRMS